jgi:hypothetical protein
MPNVFGFVWSWPLSRVMRAALPAEEGRSTYLVPNLVGRAGAGGLGHDDHASLFSWWGFSQMTVPPMPSPMHMVVMP